MADAVSRWIAGASTEDLRAKMDEYTDRDGRLSTRDQEARTILRRRIADELERRTD